MKYLLILATMFGLMFNAAAQENAKTGGAKIVFAKQSHDFGDITQGEKVKTVFTFTNDGTEPLVLSKVATTCGCTAPSWPREPVMPGEAGEIEVEFNSSGKMGMQNKVITVYSNATNPNARVKITTNVLPGSNPNK